MSRTEDDLHGGLQAVLATELARQGLPEAAGLTGLLRHIRANQDLTLANWKAVASGWQERAESSERAADGAQTSPGRPADDQTEQ